MLSAAEARRKQEAAAGGRVAKRVQRFGSDGTRERYFADDDAVDLQVGSGQQTGHREVLLAQGGAAAVVVADAAASACGVDCQ
jgi:hypothetical protein